MNKSESILKKRSPVFFFQYIGESKSINERKEQQKFSAISRKSRIIELIIKKTIWKIHPY